MKILIIEDSKNSILSAELFAKKFESIHEVTIVTNIEKVKNLLWIPPYDEGKREPEYFDVILTDLFLPAEIEGVSSDSFNYELNKEMPYGLIVMLRGIRNNVRYIGLLTNSYHHSDPITASLSIIGKMGWNESGRKSFQIGESQILLTETNGDYDDLSKDDQMYRAKNWETLFTNLTSN